MNIQSPLEEKLNTITHAFGAFLGLIGLGLLLYYNTQNTGWTIFSVVIYGISVIVLFTASALYHSVTKTTHKHYLRVLDHISIYILIAGTYSPILLIALKDSLGWNLFWVVWGIAAFGLILKLFFTGRFEMFSTLLYLIMGWLIIFDFSHLEAAIGSQGVYWLIAGGIFYTVGIIFFVFEKIPYNHVIWHLFVLAGAISHFFMIFLYVI
ncbi:PAQR family membrane homeostasis protein TrhA [Formosa algae]|uniref:Hemolysin III n=1 Tax=Formosa algae TaxID=225843 RepID=A0A9X0YQ12_9FLAO|nr:hemolysin III family protein [Formosa algae]MBP1841101.1 hemolysin III [Formosa algae]MDQ0336479.1 hemolysin III [Formosa algae]OEI81440.1 hemolysin III family protein [Formosa algae]PNW26588.1 hemolysin III family protein [Formosa algae]